MHRFETRVFRVKVQWDGGDYYLAAMVQKEDWKNIDHLGEQGWEFVAFVPDHEVFIRNSFEERELKYIRLAVFKRRLEEGEDMWTNIKAR